MTPAVRIIRPYAVDSCTARVCHAAGAGAFHRAWNVMWRSAAAGLILSVLAFFASI